MIYTIQNNKIQIAVATKGAELQSIKAVATERQYLWDGGAPWPKHSPVLFPIVGTLKNNQYIYEGARYTLTRHGFARDKEFTLLEQTASTLLFRLQSSEQTLENYPFPFELRLEYRLSEQGFSLTYWVYNKGDRHMYFSVGGHPAFKVPLYEGEQYEAYQLEFEKTETADRWLLENGLLQSETQPLLVQSNRLPLRKQLFAQDAIVLKHLQSRTLRLISTRTGKGFEFDFTGFPYLGIWAAKNADFVCIEPWCGIADAADSLQQLTEKEGIEALEAGAIFERSWRFNMLD